MATLDSNKVTGVSVVSGTSDAANKLYVDSVIDSTVPVSGNAGRFLNVSANLPGLVWYSRTSGLGGNINGVAFGNNYYVAADSTGAVVYSTDTINWVRTTSGFGGSSISSLVYYNNNFVAGGSNVINNWTSLNFFEDGFLSTIDVRSVAFGNNRFIAGGSGLSALWTQRTSGFGTSIIYTLMYDGSLYFAAGAGGTLTTSTDSINWTFRTSGRTTQLGYATGGSGLLYASGQTEPYVYAGASGALSTSTDSIHWTSRTSPNSTIAIQALAFGSLPSATYVRSTATAGEIATSTDAIAWTLRTTGNVTNVIQALLYSEATSEYYVNVRAGGAIQTSTDAISWTSRTSGTATALRQIIYGDAYVVAGDSGVLATSTNATFWSLRTSGTASALYGLAYTSGSYVASGASGVSLYSTDAVTWTLRTSGFGSSVVQAVAFGNNVFVNGGAGGALTTSTPTLLSSGGLGATINSSADGIAWTIRTTPLGAETANLLAASSSEYVAHCLDYDGLGGIIIRSTDAVTWVLRTSGFSIRTANALIYSNPFYVIGGDSGNVSWTRRTSGFGTTAINSLTFGNNLYLAGGTNSIALWTTRTSRITGNTAIIAAIFDGSQFLIGASTSGQISSSTDGIVWTLRTSGSAGQIGYSFGGNGFLYVNGATEPYVYSGSAGTLATSTNSIEWTLRTSGVTTAISSMAYGTLPSATYVWASTAGALATSTDTIQWELRTSGTTSTIQALLYSTATSEYYVNCGVGGILQTSTDAITWTLRTSGTTNDLRHLIYGDVYVVIGGPSGTASAIGVVNTSTDAIHWTLRTSGYGGAGFTGTPALWCLTYTSGSYFISGGAGQPGSGGGAIPVVLHSTDAIVWSIRTVTGHSRGDFFASAIGNDTYIGGGYNGTGNQTILSSATVTLLSNPNTGARIHSSTDTITWTIRTAPSGTLTANLLAASSSDYVAHCLDYDGIGGVIINSTDGVNWVLRTSGISGFSIRTTNVLIYANNYYLLGGDAGYVTWTQRTTGFGTAAINSLTFGNNLYLAGGAGLSVLWTQRTSGFGTSIIYTLMYDGTNYFAAGAGGTLTTSTDAITWTYRTSGRTTQIGYATGGNGLLYASGQTEPYVYAGNSGVLATSTDSISWTLRTSPNSTIAIQALAFGSLPSATYVRSTATAGEIATSTDAIAWTLRTTGNVTNVIQALLYSEATTEYYINCRAAGVLQTSTDAIAWTLRTSGTATQLNQLIYGGVYVVSGQSGVIATSTNAIEWTLRTSGTTSLLYGVAYTAGSYVVSGTNAVSLYSTDAITWLLRTSGFGTSVIQAVIFGNNVFVNGGAGGALTTSTPTLLSGSGFGARLHSSTDAINWTIRTTPTEIETANLLAASSSDYVAYCRNYDNLEFSLIQSTDSVNWVLRTSGFSVRTANSFIYGNGYYILGGDVGYASWTQRTTRYGVAVTPEGATLNINSLTYGNNRYLAGGSSVTAFWILRTSGFGTTTIRSVTFGNNLYLAAGANLSILWSQRTSGFGTSSIFTMMYDGSNYFAAGAGGTLTTSTNAVQWTYRTSGTTTQIGYATGGNGLLYASGQTEQYVYAGASGVLATSTDSIAWTLRTSPNSTIAIQAIAYGALPSATYVRSTATAGEIATSTNGIEWTLRTTGDTTNIIQELLYSTATSEYYVNVRGGGVIETSTDAIAWTLRTSGTTTVLRQLLYGDVYVVAGDSGVLATSTNAIEWTLRTSGTTSALYGLAYTAGSYVASGASGVSLYSTDAITWFARTSAFGTSVIQSTVFGNNIFANVGVSGILSTSTLTTLSSAGLGVRIHSSTDTITWIVRTAPFGTENANLLASSGSDYVAHCLNYDGIGGVVINSTDGVNWVLRTSSISGFSIRTANALIYANGNYLLGGELVYAPWTLRTSGFGTSSIFTMMYDGSNYFAAGADGTLTTSTNTIQWTYRTSGVTAQLGSSVGGNGLLYVSGATEPYVYAGASGVLATSTDSIAWTLRTSPNSTYSIQAITYGALPSATYVRSAAILPWVPTPTDPLFPNLWYDASDTSSVTLSGSTVSTWVNKGSLGSTYNLTQATASRQPTYAATQNGLRTMTFDGSNDQMLTSQLNNVTHIFVASAWSAAGASSTDYKGFLSSNSYDWHGEASAVLVSNTYAASWVKTQPTQSTSQLDGSNFVNITNNKWTTFSIYSINLQTGYTGGFSGTGTSNGDGRQFQGDYGEILVYQNTRLTTDQINFITGYLAWKWGSQSLLPVSHPYKTFAPGSEGDIATSTNAISWTLRTTGDTTNIIQELLYSTATSEYYVNVRGGGVIETSTDAIAWTLRTSGTTTSLRQIVYGDAYVVAGDSGVLATSTNAIEWTLRTSGTTSALYGLAYTAGSYVASGASGVSLYSTDAITWFLRTSGFGSSAVQAVVFGNNIFVNGGSGGTLATSPTSLVSTLGPGGLLVASTDSITWSLRTTGSNINITGLAASGSLYVASSINNIGQSQIITSTDTINWVSRTSGFGTTRINALSYGNEYVAIANNNLWWASTDSIVWSARTVAFGGTAHNNNKIVFGAGTYTATAPNNSTFSYVSTDSIVWFSRTLSLSSNDLTFGNNIFIAVGTLSSTGAIATQSTSSSLISPGLFGSGARIHSSTDTITWTIRTTPLGAETANLLASSGSDYVAHCLDYDNNAGIVINSTDSVTWVLRTSGFSEVSGFTLRTANSLIYANNYYLLGGTTRYAPWTLRSSGFGTSSIFTMMYDGSNYFAAGAGGTLTTSTNAVQWTYRTSGTTAQIGPTTLGGNGLLYAAGQTEPYVYAGASGVLATSTDSIAWTLRTSPNSTIAIQALAFGSLPSATYVRSTATAGEIATSTNGIEWTLRTTGNVTNVIQELLYSTATSEYYVNVRGAGVIQTSTDAISWTTRTSGTTTVLRQLLYGDVYVVAGDSGVLTTSTNAIEWTLRTSGTTSALYGLAYTAGSYVASGASGVSLYSTDAITWFLRTSGFGTSIIQAVTFGNNIFVQGGVGATLTTSSTAEVSTLGTGALLSASTDTITWTLRTTGENISVTALTASNTLYVANVLNNINQNQVIVSTDTINWILRTSGFGNTTINTLGYDTTYVAAGNSGFVWSSTDSIVWILRTSGTTQNLNSISVASGAYIASGAAGVNIASTDAITWFLRTSGFGTSVINAVTFGNDLFVNGGVGGTLTTSTLSSLTTLGPGGLLVASTDAVTWGLRTTGANVNVTALTTSGALYVANALNNISQNQVIVSTDTINWVSRTSGFGFTRINALSYESISGIYVAAGNSGFVWSSTDSIVWTLRTSSTPQNLNAVSSTSGLYTASGAAGVNIASTDAITWFLRTSGFGTSVINAVTFGNNLFVNGGVGGTLTTSSSTILPSLGPGGLLVASTDAITWILRTTGSNVNITALTSDGSLFVANAINNLNENRVLVSTDTITWTDNAQIGFTRINALGYDTFYVAVGNSGVAWSSTNTIVWILRTSTTAQNLNGIASFSGTYVASGAAGTSLVSGDGIVWVTRTSGFGSSAINAVTFGNGLFVNGGVGGTLTVSSNPALGAILSTSTNGTQWVLRTAVANSRTITALAANNTFYIANIIDHPAVNQIMVSTDTINWISRTSGFGSTQINALTTGGIYVAAGNSGFIRSSTDSIAWVTRTSGFGTSNITTLSYTPDGAYLAGSAGGNIRSSSDGIHWFSRTSGTTNQINSFANSATRYVAGGAAGTLLFGDSRTLSYLGNGGLVSTSTNGIQWTLRTTCADIQSTTVLIAGGSFYIGAGTNYLSQSVIIASTDSINWVLRTTPFGTTVLNALEYHATDNYTVAGNTGILGTSTDSFVWILRTSAFGTNAITALAHNQSNLYVAGGASGILNTSSDGISWVLRTSGFGTSQIFSLAYETSSGYYIAASAGGVIRTSTDAIAWEIRTSPTTNQLNAISNTGVYGGFYLIGGNTRTLLASSTDTTQIKWTSINATNSGL